MSASICESMYLRMSCPTSISIPASILFHGSVGGSLLYFSTYCRACSHNSSTSSMQLMLYQVILRETCWPRIAGQSVACTFAPSTPYDTQCSSQSRFRNELNKRLRSPLRRAQRCVQPLLHLLACLQPFHVYLHTPHASRLTTWMVCFRDDRCRPNTRLRHTDKRP